MECLLRCIHPLQILNVLVNVSKAVGVLEARRTRIDTACLEPTTIERNAPPPKQLDGYLYYIRVDNLRFWFCRGKLFNVSRLCLWPTIEDRDYN